MKSTIKIDIDGYTGTEPVIRITREDTDDLRDKFLGIFLERLQHSSNFCFIEYTGTPGIWNIYAVPGTKAGFMKYLEQCGGEQVHMIAEVCKELIDSYPKVTIYKEAVDEYMGISARIDK